MFGPYDIDNIQGMSNEQIANALITPYFLEKERVLQGKMRGVDPKTITAVDLFSPEFFDSVRSEKKASVQMNYGMYFSEELQKVAGWGSLS